MDPSEFGELIKSSVNVWGYPTSITVPTGDRLEVTLHYPVPLHIAYCPAHQRTPFWEFRVGESVTAYPSIPVLLRALREHLDPTYVPGKAIIGIRPLASAL